MNWAGAESVLQTRIVAETGGKKGENVAEIYNPSLILAVIPGLKEV